MSPLYREIESYDQGMLDVGDSNLIYCILRPMTYVPTPCMTSSATSESAPSSPPSSPPSWPSCGRQLAVAKTQS